MKSFFNLNSIHNRIILFGIFLLSMGAVGRILVLSDYLRDDLIEQSSTQLRTLADYAAHDVDHNLTERREFLEHVAAQLPPELLRQPDRLRAWLGERYELNPLFPEGLIVLDVTGKVLVDYPAVAGRPGLSFADRDYFTKAMQGVFVFGRPVADRLSKRPVMPMSIPLKDPQGKTRAVLAGITALDAPGFLETLYHTKVGANGALILVSPQDEMFVASSQRSLSLQPTPAKGQHAQHDRAMMGWRGVGIDVNIHGEEELAALASVPSTGWFLVARLPTDEVYAPISRLRRFIISNSSALFVVFVVLMVLGLRYLLGPLKQAAEHADRMTRGEISLRPLPIVRNDEVGHLTAAFNGVLGKLLESRAELEHLAHHDVLTGLPNRQLLTDRIKQAFARAQRNGSHVAVLFMDLNGFKPINDALGHDAGDEALRQVAARLSEVVRRADTLARVGGDEFVVLLSDLEGDARAAAESVARKCQEIFSIPFDLNGEQRTLGTSIGIAIGDGSCPADKLLIAADHAMYRSKESGDGQIHFSETCSACLASGAPRHCVVHRTHSS